MDAEHTNSDIRPAPPPNWDGIPRHYLHSKCGVVTQISDDIISNYLADPYYYMSGTTICARCGVVLDKDCTWTETGETLDVYMRRLKSQKSTAYHVVRWTLPFVFGIIGCFLLPLIPRKPGVAPMDPNLAHLLGFAVGLLPGFFLARFPRLILCKIGLI